MSKLPLSEMDRGALLREVRVANSRKDHFRVAACKRELVRRRKLEIERDRANSEQHYWWQDD